LKNPSGASVAFPQVNIAIVDDDAPPTLSVTDVTVAEVAGAKAVFVVRLSAASGKTVPVSFATVNGTANAGSDYTTTNGAFPLSMTPAQFVDKLNQFNGNFVQAEMVKAFISSIEYKQRFDQP
jgi:hypothetical protein